MKFILALTLTALSIPSFADEALQMSYALGNWATNSGGVFSYTSLMIRKSPDGKSLDLLYCDPYEIIISGTCKKALPYQGRAVFNKSSGKILVAEGPGSPNPSYEIEIDAKNTDVLIRHWGTETVRYLRLPMELMNKTTSIDSAISPSNVFVKCVVQSALKAAYGSDRTVLVYSYSNGVGEIVPPRDVSIFFVTKDSKGVREGLQVVLQSTDSVRNWQIVQGESGEIYYFSVGVSSKASLHKREGGPAIKSFDISNCQ